MTKSRDVSPTSGLAGSDSRQSGAVPPHAAFHLLRPAEVRLDPPGSRLIFRDQVGQREPDEVKPTRKMLDQFLTLASDRDGSRIRSFACNWGPLGVCKHDRSLLACFCTTPRMMPGEDRGYWEPIATWRDLAIEMGAILRVGTALQANGKARLVDTQAFPEPERGLYAEAMTADEEHVIFSTQVTGWLIRAGTRPWFTWYGGEQVFGLGYNGVFGAVGAQLLALLGSPTAICAACGNLFTPSRQPVAGKRTWCGEPRCRLARGARMASDKRQRDNLNPRKTRGTRK